MIAVGRVEIILAVVRRVPAQLGIDPPQQVSHNNFQPLPRYEHESLPGGAIADGYGLGVMQEIPCDATELATPYLDEIQESPDDENAVILATGKIVAHFAAVEGSEQVAAVRVLDCSTVLRCAAAGRVLL